MSDIKPGSRVITRLDLSAYGSLPAVREGTPGRVVRLVHSRIEGEPLPGHQDTGEQMTIAHVVFDGISIPGPHGSIYPIGVSLLRVLQNDREPS